MNEGLAGVSTKEMFQRAEICGLSSRSNRPGVNSCQGRAGGRRKEAAAQLGPSAVDGSSR